MDTPTTPSAPAPAPPSASGEPAGRFRGRPGGPSPWTLVIAAAVLTIDQLTKWWAVNNLEEPVHLVWTLRLVLAYNTGTAFSLGAGLGPLIGILAVVIVIVLVRLGRTVMTPVGIVGLGLVLGGAVGNLADRLFRESHGFLHGAVVDFIDLQWWPIFNLADSAIVIGGILLVLTGLGQDVKARAS